MELFAYVRFRWKALVAGLLVGLAIIAGISSVAGSSGDYTARTQLLIRPPAAQLSVFAFDLDRYIGSEIAFLYSDAGLKSEAAGTSMSASELRSALSYTHASESDVVTLTVTSASRREAVATANSVAQTYIDGAQTRDQASNTQSSTFVQKQLEQAQTSLRRANAKIAAATRAYRRNNPDSATVPDALVLAPNAFDQQQTATQQVLQLQQQLADVQLALQAPGLSRILDAATDASPSASSWRPLTILAAVAGLLLALLAIAAIALSLSDRVISVNRWRQVAGSALTTPIDAGRQSRARRRASVRRIKASLLNMNAPGPAAVIPFPESTRRLDRRMKRLVKGLKAADVPCSDDREASLPDLLHDDHEGQHKSKAATLVCVDLTACRMEDVSILAGADSQVRRLIVPVLV